MRGDVLGMALAGGRARARTPLLVSCRRLHAESRRPMGCAEIPAAFGQPGRAGGKQRRGLRQGWSIFARVVGPCGQQWAPAAPGWGGHRQARFGQGSRRRAGGAELHPGVSRQQRGSFKGILQREAKLGHSRGPAPHPGGQRHPAEEPAGSPKNGITCFNFGIRQEEDGFVSSATPFQLFPERQRLEDVAGPNYNIGEPTPAALPSFAPAAGTVSSSRASCLMEGFPLQGGPVPRAPVLRMALHKAWLRTGVSAPLWGFPRLGTGRGSCCQTPVLGRRYDGDQKHRAVPQAPPGTGSQAVLLLQASAVPICRR